MADYKTADYIVGIVRGLLSTITVPKYLHTRPADISDAEFIVINSLPVDANVMQKCYVNVNYHVRDIGPGQPDEVKIRAGEALVLAIVKKVSSTSYLIDFESNEIIRETQFGEHYSNIRISFKNINT